MSYEVCPGQCLRHSGTEYPAGSLAPALENAAELEARGVIRRLAGPPPVRPKPVVKKKAPAKKKPAAKKATE